MNGERRFKGTLSFALAHTQACYKDSEPFTIFTFRGFLFFFGDLGDLKCEQTGETPLCGCHNPINVRNKQNIKKKKKKCTKSYCHFDRKWQCILSVFINILSYSVLILLRIFNLAIWISQTLVREGPLSLALILTKISITMSLYAHVNTVALSIC